MRAVPAGLGLRYGRVPSAESAGLSSFAPTALWLLRRAQGDRKTEKEKLEQALAIFTELKMPRERDAVQVELDKLINGW